MLYPLLLDNMANFSFDLATVGTVVQWTEQVVGMLMIPGSIPVLDNLFLNLHFT